MSEIPNAVTAEAAVTGAVASMAELIASLSVARDEPTILAATMNYLERFRVREARLFCLQTGDAGALTSAQAVATWREGKIVSDSSTEGALRPIDGEPLLRPLVETPQEQLVISEGSADAPAFALLQLRSESAVGWHGVLSLSWEATHVFKLEERSAYRLLSFTLAMYVNGLRSRRQLDAALEEASILHSVTRQLNVALSLEEVMRALLQPSPFCDEAEVTLCSIENDAQGQPEWVKIVSVFTGGAIAQRTDSSARFYLPDIPFAKLYLSSPDAPLIISDIENDPRVDEYSRQLYAATNCKATIVMALTLQGRWVGLFNITWRRTVPIGEREKRVYQGLAKQAALLLDNSLMLERLHSSFKETQQQGALMQRILDHLPVGVALLDGATGRPLLGNAHIDRLLGRTMSRDLTAEGSFDAYHFVEPGTEHPIPVEELPSRRAVRSQKMETAEVDILQPNGERLSTETTAVPVVDESGAVKNVIILVSDLTSRRRAEHERTKLQEEIIRVQAAALAERSSPLIPITDDILVLPLIGSIDTERGHQVLDTVLQGTSQRGARVAIIDITGVRTVDTQAASALTNAAQALRLLGVDPVLTGIRPEVAQTLVSLGVRLEGIVTRSTLQSGIQYALKRLNKRSMI